MELHSLEQAVLGMALGVALSVVPSVELQLSLCFCLVYQSVLDQYLHQS
jgi:hypothetical protein